MYVKYLFINEISHNGINDEIIKYTFLICDIVIKIKHIKYVLKFMIQRRREQSETRSII